MISLNILCFDRKTHSILCLEHIFMFLNRFWLDSIIIRKIFHSEEQPITCLLSKHLLNFSSNLWKTNTINRVATSSEQSCLGYPYVTIDFFPQIVCTVYVPHKMWNNRYIPFLLKNNFRYRNHRSCSTEMQSVIALIVPCENFLNLFILPL